MTDVNAGAQAPQSNAGQLDQDLNLWGFSFSDMMPDIFGQKSPTAHLYEDQQEQGSSADSAQESKDSNDLGSQEDQQSSEEGSNEEGTGDEDKNLDNQESDASDKDSGDDKSKEEESKEEESKEEKPEDKPEEKKDEEEEEDKSKEEKKEDLDEEKQDILDLVNKLLWEDWDNKKISDATKDLEDAAKKADKNPTDKNIEKYKEALNELKHTLQDERFESESTKRQNNLLKQRIEQQDEAINKLQLESMKNKPIMKVIDSDEGIKNLVQTLGEAKKNDNKDMAIDQISKYLKNNYDMDLKKMIKEQLETNKKRMQTTGNGGVPEPKNWGPQTPLNTKGNFTFWDMFSGI